MFFYDNQLELDESSQLPMNHVSTIRFDQTDSSRAWIGCSDGEIYRFEMETLQADHHFAHEQAVADLVSTDDYLLCLSKTCIKLFDIQQSNIRRCDDHEGRSANRHQNSKKRYLNGEFKCCSAVSGESKSDHLVKLGSRSALSCLCEFDKDKYLLGGSQSDVLLFDANQLKIVNKFPICQSGSASSCIKMKRIGSRDLIVTSTLGGRMVITMDYNPNLSLFSFGFESFRFLTHFALVQFIHDRNSLKPILTFRSFALCNFDFDVINENYILTTGSNSR